MDNKAILNEIAKNAAILESHIKRLKEKPESLHDIDIDLMSEKLKEIYSLIHNLLPDEGVYEESPELEVESPEIEKERAPKTEDQTTEETPISDPQPPAPSPQPSATSEQPPAPSPQPPEPKPDPIPVPLPPSPQADPEPTKTTADLFSGPTTIADKFQAKEDNSIAATVSTHPAQDLKMAIGINDKFLFINELFQGDPSVYNQAIDNMNTAGGLAQALSALDGYRAEYNWADNSESYHRLKKIVNAKYNG